MTQLVKYEAACHALAECKAVDEVKAWADKAAAMQAYGRMANDKTLEVDAAEIRLRAERRLGELIAAQKAVGGLATGARGQLAGKGVGGLAVVTNDRQKNAPRLADAGISKDLSSRAQRLAAVPEAEFEAEVGQWRERVSAEGARVSARLEAAGAREMQRAAPHVEPQTPSPADDYDPVAELEKAHAEIQKLTEEIKAAEADDLKREAIKWRRAYEHAERQQAEAMDRATKERRMHERKHKELMRCGKAVGETDPDKVVAAVLAFVRKHSEVAA